MERESYPQQLSSDLYMHAMAQRHMHIINQSINQACFCSETGGIGKTLVVKSGYCSHRGPKFGF